MRLWTGERLYLSDIEEEEGLRQRERGMENGGVMSEEEEEEEEDIRVRVRKAEMKDEEEVE